MPYEFLPHTADIAVRAWADGPEALFAAAAAALTGTLVDPDTVRAADAVSVTCSAPDLDLLLHAFLSEILFQFDGRRRLVSEVTVTFRREDDLLVAEATTVGEPFDAGRHRVKVLVKAVTYHALAVTEHGGRWEATVVFDV